MTDSKPSRTVIHKLSSFTRILRKMEIAKWHRQAVFNWRIKRLCVCHVVGAEKICINFYIPK